MTIVKTFRCGQCGCDKWNLYKSRYGADVWLQFQCASCGGTANAISYEQTIDGIEKLIDADQPR